MVIERRYSPHFGNDVKPPIHLSFCLHLSFELIVCNNSVATFREKAAKSESSPFLLPYSNWFCCAVRTKNLDRPSHGGPSHRRNRYSIVLVSIGRPTLESVMIVATRINARRKIRKRKIDRARTCGTMINEPNIVAVRYLQLIIIQRSWPWMNVSDVQ